MFYRVVEYAKSHVKYAKFGYKDKLWGGYGQQDR